jgi:hypothetical protein
VVVDAMNAMVTIPGQFKSFGHDYRGDTARFVQAAYGLPPVSEDQMESLHATLVARELDRADRIKNTEAGDPETDRRVSSNSQ